MRRGHGRWHGEPYVDETYVYRCFDKHHRPLYVGMTGDVETRMAQHRRLKDWAADVAMVEVTVHPSVEVASRVETAEIVRLDPLGNVRDAPHAREQHSLNMRRTRRSA